jgi:hypothetical protein
MKSMRAITLELLLVTGLTVMGCSSEMSSRGDTGWITLLDGSNPKTLENWNRIGDANWRAEDGAIVADKGKGGHLVSKNSYKDLQIRAEFWADHSTNSGIFFRVSDPTTIGSKTLTRRISTINARGRNTAPERSSMSPRCLRSRGQAASGIPSKSRPKAQI